MTSFVSLRDIVTNCFDGKHLIKMTLLQCEHNMPQAYYKKYPFCGDSQRYSPDLISIWHFGVWKYGPDSPSVFYRLWTKLIQ